MQEVPVIAVIGVGTMSEAIVRLALEDGWPRDKFVLTHRRSERRAELERRYGGAVESDNVAAAQKGDAVLVSVRPQQFERMLDELQPALDSDQFFISIAAALDIPWLERHLPKGMAVIRAVPPPTSWIRAGLGFLSANVEATEQQRQVAERLFQPTCERILWLPDELVDAATGIGPAVTPYSCLIIQALIQAGIDQGVPEDLAREVAYEGLLAAGRMICQGGYTPDEIIRMVATPEGLTWASLHTMEKYGVPEGIRAGALAMTTRSMELRGEPIPPEMPDFER
jgi:pyrroline-5-carboxylate reductase